MKKLLVFEDETLVNEFGISSNSPISSKPSPRVEGLGADFFHSKCLKGMENRRFGRKKSNFMLERNGLLF